MFIDAQKAVYGIRLLCRVLNVPESSYFDWDVHGRDRADVKARERSELLVKIQHVFDESAETYGAEKVHGELVDGGEVVSRRRVAELMADEGLQGLSGREGKSTTTTRRDRLRAPFPDLVNGEFHPPDPDQIWYGDITYIWVAGKFWYMATVIDASTKELLGWSFRDHMRAELISEALDAAVTYRGGSVRRGIIFHSDRGSQYTGIDYGKACFKYGMKRSMGRRGVCYDNAAAESFFSILKRELVDRYHWESAEQLRLALFVWINTWYNRRRRHTTLQGRAPVADYELKTRRSTAA